MFSGPKRRHIIDCLILTASIHVKFRDIEDYMSRSNEIKKFFHKEGIHSTTIQLEFDNPSEPTGSKCMIVCTGDNCADMTCCKVNETTTTLDTYSLEEKAQQQQQHQQP